MGSARDDVTLATAIASLHNNVHYLGAIANMARQREVVVSQAVVSDTGTVLLEKGSVLGAEVQQVLAAHRLPGPLDAHLAVSEPVDVGALHVEVSRLLADHPLGQLLAAELGADGALLGRALRQMVWPHPARFKMTVVQDQLPSLFEHSVLMAMVAVFLAIRAGWDEPQCAKVAAAALLHDVGMLYMSSAWTNAEYKLTDRERSQLAVHSITGSMVVQAMQAYPFSVEAAVLEHHECMDGSGYPRHLQGDAISPMGRMLVVAEVVSAFFGKYDRMAAERLSLMLRLNSRRYPAEQVAPVLVMLQRAAREGAAIPRADVLRDCQTVATVLQYWASCKRVLPAQWQGMAGARAVMWVEARLRALELSLAESGAHARPQAEWQTLLDADPLNLLELGLIHREALWQMHSCIDTCQRRWPLAASPASVLEKALATWIHSSRQALQAGSLQTAAQASQAA